MRLKTFLFCLFFALFSMNTGADEKKGQPVLLWEQDFNPPIREISDQNSKGDFLAVQLDKKGSRPEKILVIDARGAIKREELLPGKRKRTIPAEQVWLTAQSEEEVKKLKKAKMPKKIETRGRELLLARNGEYYGIVTQYGNWYELEYKNKDGKTLCRIVPRDNYGFWSAFISHDGERIVTIDMGGLGGGDEFEVFGQRLSFYDRTGKLLKEYDYGRKIVQWINQESFTAAPDGNHFAATRATASPTVNDTSVVLFDRNGAVVWDRGFGRERHRVTFLSDSLLLVKTGADYAALDLDGNDQWKFRGDPNIFFTAAAADRSGRTLLYLLVLGNLSVTKPLDYEATDKNAVYVFDFHTGQLVIQGKKFVDKPWLGSLTVSPDGALVAGSSLNYLAFFNADLQEVWRRDLPATPFVFARRNLVTVMLENSRKARTVAVYDISSFGRP